MIYFKAEPLTVDGGWIPLGSGQAESLGIAPKAALLDRAAKNGLQVPAGWILPDGVSAEGLPVGMERLGVLAVRSSFSAEDQAGQSNAGRFHTELGVNAHLPDVQLAVDLVRESGSEVPSSKRDVLVMQQVHATRAGVAFTERSFEDDMVNVVSGLADSLVSGEEAGDVATLAKLRRLERSGPGLEPWQERLSLLLRDARQLFGAGDWDIEWADDDHVCWLVQIRPITVAPLRNEVFTLANHKEILPELPSNFMTSVIEESSDQLLDFYRKRDPSLPLDREFVKTFAGRPYLNLSMLTDMMRSLGLPSGLVTESYGGQALEQTGLRPWRMFQKLPTLFKLAIAQTRAVSRADAIADELETSGSGPFATVTSAVDGFQRSYVQLVSEMGALASAMAPAVAILKRTGTLDSHLARNRTAATTMLDDLAPMRALLAKDPTLRAPLTEGRIPERQEFRQLWAKWEQDHGHRGVFESDLARPRFAEQPDPILRSVTAPATSGVGPSPRRSLLSFLSTPLWAIARKPMTSRERLRSKAMKGFSGFRWHLLEAAVAAEANGQLPDRADIWLLRAAEVRSLDTGSVFTEDDLANRRAERARLLAIRVPDTVRRFDDVENPQESEGHQGSAFIGVPLVPGLVSGWAFRCSEPPAHLPDGFEPETTVLVARSVDAGWVPAFSHVAAVAVEIGGDLSHGSIILRELGIPSVTNLGEIRAGVVTGSAVTLDATKGILRLDS